MSGLIRILIADDHPLFRAGLRSLLESVSDTEVVGEATTGPEAVELTAREPDVVVMDINMPDLKGSRQRARSSSRRRTRTSS